MGEAFEVALSVKRVRANLAQVVQGIVAVTRALGRDNRACFPARTWCKEQLALDIERRAGVQVVPGQVIPRIPVTTGVAHGDAEPERAGHQRSGRRAAHVGGAEIAEGTDQAPRPSVEGGTGARDVDQAANGVPPVQGALRSPDELDLPDVREIDAR